MTKAQARDAWKHAKFALQDQVTFKLRVHTYQHTRIYWRVDCNMLLQVITSWSAAAADQKLYLLYITNARRERLHEGALALHGGNGGGRGPGHRHGVERGGKAEHT